MMYDMKHQVQTIFAFVSPYSRLTIQSQVNFLPEPGEPRLDGRSFYRTDITVMGKIQGVWCNHYASHKFIVTIFVWRGDEELPTYQYSEWGALIEENMLYFLRETSIFLTANINWQQPARMSRRFCSCDRLTKIHSKWWDSSFCSVAGFTSNPKI